MREYLEVSEPFLQTNPDEEAVWLVRAAVALELDLPVVGAGAARELLRLRADTSADPQTVKLMVKLDRRGWLEKDFIAKQTAQEDMAAALLSAATEASNSGKNEEAWARLIELDATVPGSAGAAALKKAVGDRPKAGAAQLLAHAAVFAMAEQDKSRRERLQSDVVRARCAVVDISGALVGEKFLENKRREFLLPFLAIAQVRDGRPEVAESTLAQVTDARTYALR